MYRYGFAGLKKVVSNPKTTVTSIPQYSAVRVKDIILDNSHPLFEQYGGWNSIGTIFYDQVSSPTPLPPNKLPYALPFFSNIKNYPLVNEIVYLLLLPDLTIDQSTVNKVSYYFTPLNIWNSQHHNAYPDNIYDNNTPESLQKNYIQTSQGSPNIVPNNEAGINLGQTFKEKSNINPLLPYEGDMIFEGRWGNSIRIGSTVKNSNIKNLWSSFGDDGDPIIILRNGQGVKSNNGWENILENINEDLSSLYITSKQKIPINVSSKRYSSFSTKPTDPQEYNNNQIILNSGRILLNSNLDHILLSSIKSVGFSSIESVNVDTNIFVVNSTKSYLGSIKATEPILLGNQTTDLLKQLISNLQEFMQVCSILAYGKEGTPITQLNLISAEVKLVLDNLITNIDSIKSKNNFTT